MLVHLVVAIQDVVEDTMKKKKKTDWQMDKEKWC
jgi:hypothetical protein